MLSGTETIQEILEFFKNYAPRKNQSILIGKARNNNNDASDMDTDNDNEYEMIGSSSSSGGSGGREFRELKGVKPNNKINKSNNLGGGRNDLNANNLKSGRSSNKNKKSAATKNLPSLSDSGVHGEGEWLQNTESSIDENFALDAERTIPTFQLSCDDVNNYLDEFQNKQNDENNQGLLKKRNVFDVLDSDVVKNKIPFMHPDSKKCTFRCNREYKMYC